MELLCLQLCPLEKDPSRFKVIVSDENIGSSNQCEASLPFWDKAKEKDRRFTVVKMLEAAYYRAEDFPEAEERDWMVQEQLLNQEQNAFCHSWLKRVGEKLYDCLNRQCQEILQGALNRARQQNMCLHIQFKFPYDAPKFSRFPDYPWEVMADNVNFLAPQGVTFSREISEQRSRSQLSPTEKLRVLLVSSKAIDPDRGLGRLSDEEGRAISAGLEAAEAKGIIQVEPLLANRNALSKRLMQCQEGLNPHVLHFDGHGYFGRRCDQDGCRTMHEPTGKDRCDNCKQPLPDPQGYLVFEHEQKSFDYVSANELGDLLGNLTRNDKPNLQRGIILAVLSGCKTGLSLLYDSVFNGVAQNLIGQGIPAVVAMQYSVSVQGARDFAESFYCALGNRESLAIALRRGQTAMGISGQQWYRPVLYLRWQDNKEGQLFAKTAAQVASDAPKLLENNNLASKVKTGIELLIDLISREPEVREAIYRSKEVIENTYCQIGIIEHYKTLHDKLHFIEATCLNNILDYKLPQLSPRQLQKYSSNFLGTKREIEICLQRQKISTASQKDFLESLKDVSKAFNDLVSSPCDDNFDTVISELTHLVTTIMPILDQGIVYIAGELKLDRLLELLQSIQPRLNEVPNEQDIFVESICSLQQMRDELNVRVDEHNQLQKIDLQLRPVCMTTKEISRISTIKDTWKYITRTIDNLVPPFSQELEGEMNNILTAKSKIELVLTNYDNKLVEDCDEEVLEKLLNEFNELYFTSVVPVFREVDTELKKFCSRLSLVNQSLKTLMEMLNRN